MAFRLCISFFDFSFYHFLSSSLIILQKQIQKKCLNFYFFPKSELNPLRAPPATTDLSPAFVKSLFPVNKPNPVAAAPPANTVPPTTCPTLYLLPLLLPLL